MKPIGGTELQYALLQKHVDNKLLEKFQITTSIPEKEPLSKDKINILWVQNSYDQPNLAPWFKDKSNHDKYDWYVFNSHWCVEKYRMMFDLPQDKCTVIKNAIEHFPKITQHRKHEKIKMIYTSTPWRGLSVLLGARQLVKNELVELDVYSSTQIYGQNFHDAHKDIYEPLFEQARQLPNVKYMGYATNDYITNEMSNYNLFVYPNIWEETSCISAIEALGAGIHCITTNYGALYETCSEWPTYVQYTNNYRKLAEAFAFAIDGIADQLHLDGMRELCVSQQMFYKKFYSWDNRKNEWNQFLQGALHAKPRTDLV